MWSASAKRTIGRRRKELEAKGEIESQERRKGLDDRTRGKPTGATAPVEETEEDRLEREFNEWFSEHVVPRLAKSNLAGKARKASKILTETRKGVEIPLNAEARRQKKGTNGQWFPS